MVVLPLRWQTIKIMSERIPRKFKKACKTYKRDVPIKTKLLR